MRQIELPYIYLSKLQLTVLIDTGASESIINPEIANLFPNNIYLEPFEIIPYKSRFCENQSLVLPIFKELGISNEIIFSWHNNFDALIDTKDLITWKGIIDYYNQTLLNNLQKKTVGNNNDVLQIPPKNKALHFYPPLKIKDYIIPD